MPARGSLPLKTHRPMLLRPFSVIAIGRTISVNASISSGRGAATLLRSLCSPMSTSIANGARWSAISRIAPSQPRWTATTKLHFSWANS